MAKNNNDEFKRNFNNRNIKRTSGKNTYDMFDIAKMRSANAQIKEFLDKQERMIKNNQKLDETDAKIYETQKKQYELNEKIMKNWNRYINSTLANRSDKGAFFDYVVATQQAQSRPAINFNQGGLRQIPNNVQKLFQTRISNNQNKELDDIYKTVTKSVTDSYKRKNADFSDPKVLEQVNKEIQEKVIKQSEGIVKKYGRHTDVLNVATQIFSKAVDKWYSIAMKGLNNQSNVYEDTFTNISVRNGTTRSQYYGAQSKLNNVLSDMGLRNNIASSDVQQMWNTMANSGIAIDMSTEERRASITAKAIDNVLTGSIVPYLKTSTAQWDQLITAQPELQKNIRGINRLNNDIVGNNYVTQDLLQTILDDLQPISDSAVNDLAMSASGATAYINSLMESGMDEATAKSIWTQYYKQQQYGSQILSSGTVAEKVAMVNAMTSGINIYDSKDTGKGLNNIAQTYASISGWGPGYGNTTSGVVQSIVNGATGISPQFAMWAYSQGGDIQKELEEALQNSEKAMEMYEKYGDMATQDFQEDKNQTNKKLQDVTMENLMNELAVANEWMGNWTEVIVTAIDAIGTLILTKVVGGAIGKSLGLLGGSAAGGSGAGLLAAGGGIALATIGGVAAGLAITKAIDDAAHKEAKKQNNNDVKRSNMAAKGLSEELGISEDLAGIEMAGSNIYNSEANWLGTKFDSYQAAELFGAKLGMFDTLDEKDFIQTMDAATSDVDPLKYNKAKIGRSLMYKGLGATPTVLSNIAKAWAIGLYSQGYDGNNSDILKALQETLGFSYTPNEDNMLEMMSNYTALTRSQYNQTVKAMTDADMWLWNAAGKWVMPNESDYDKVLKLKGLDAEQVEWLNSHRYGLDTVPYDEYPALLHEGEAVLTASTANTLRNLLDEYQQTSTQAVNFEAIIQTQTAELINKMSEIINVIQSGSSAQQLDNLDKMKTNSILTNSFMHLKSTKSF